MVSISNVRFTASDTSEWQKTWKELQNHSPATLKQLKLNACVCYANSKDLLASLCYESWALWAKTHSGLGKSMFGDVITFLLPDTQSQKTSKRHPSLPLSVMSSAPLPVFRKHLMKVLFTRAFPSSNTFYVLYFHLVLFCSFTCFSVMWASL